MCCELVEPVALAEQLTPEDLYEVIHASHAACTAVIQRFGGSIVRHLGEGLLVYFGYPQAQEDAAQRAVRTGLDIIHALEPLNARLAQQHGIRVAMRLAIHTGLVVVGDIETGPHVHHMVIGSTPHVAARLLGVAEPDTVVVSAAVWQLVQGYFMAEDLGQQRLPGAGGATPLPVYRILRATGAQTRLEIAAAQELTPFVGRRRELAVLQECWTHVVAGQGQVVLFSGEPGIGKSRLVHVFTDSLAETPHMLATCRCAPYQQQTALYPLIDLLQRWLAWEDVPLLTDRVKRLEQLVQEAHLELQTSVALLAPLLALTLPEERYPPLQLSPQQQRQRTLETLMALLLAVTVQHPVILVVEDLHWSDPSTLAFLGLLVDQGPTASILTLLTCRPEFHPPWFGREHMTSLTLNRLLPSQVETMIHTIPGARSLPAAVVQQVVARTDGVPLFVEELTRGVLEAVELPALARSQSTRNRTAVMTIPATLHDSLMARLDRLGEAKSTAQLLATVGREAALRLLQAVSPLAEESLHQALGQLLRAELLYQRGVGPQATYVFKHALIQDTAYQSLVQSTRQQYHARIAHALAEQFPEVVVMQPELVAHHYTEAGRYGEAIPYWHQAGQYAIQRSANLEAVSHLTRGLDVLATFPETAERAQCELALSITLGAPLLMTQGYAAADVERVYSRVQQLCQQVDDTRQVFSALYGLCAFYLVRGDCQRARQVGQQVLLLAQQSHEPDFILLAHAVLGATLFFCGEFTTALLHLEQGHARYDPAQHHALAFRYGDDPGVLSLAYLTVTLWMLGYPDQARTRSNAAVALARQLGHPFSLAVPLVTAAVCSQFRREKDTAQHWAEAIIALSTEQGFVHWLGAGMIFRGWALAYQGHSQEGIEQLHQGLTTWRATGASLILPYWLAMLAEAYRWAGQPEEGLRTLATACVAAKHNREPWWEAHLQWLKGELLLTQHGPQAPLQDVETCFQQALATARHQQAKSLELRAAISLSRLWQRQDKRAEAHELLGSIYGWFTEGFDTADLQEARVLLEELRG